MFEVKVLHSNLSHSKPPTPRITHATSLSRRFTEEWKARLRHRSVPPEALPPALKRMFEGKEVEKQLFKRSISRAPSFAEGGDGAGSRAAGAKVAPLS